MLLPKVLFSFYSFKKNQNANHKIRIGFKPFIAFYTKVKNKKKSSFNEAF
jgi:hypothetical protein